MAQFFNKIGQLGLGIALAGGVINSALYNGKLYVILIYGIFFIDVSVHIFNFTFLFTNTQLMVVIGQLYSIVFKVLNKW